MLSGMTAMIRSRFSTPTIGREGMIGEVGVAEVDIAPDGVVLIRDALWRARTNRATPITAGRRRHAWSRSRASCSRSNRPRAAPRTTGTASRRNKEPDPPQPTDERP